MAYKHTEDIQLSNGSIIYWSRRKRTKVQVECGQCGDTRWLYIQNVTAEAFTGLCQKCSRGNMRKHTDIETLPNGSIIYWNERQEGGRDAEIPIKCGICGQIRTRPASRIPNKNFTGYCVDCARTGPRSHFWKGGRIHHPSGYILIRLTPDHPFYDMADSHNLVPEHRLIMAEHIGRLLRKDEIVHHKNGIKDDNRLENLELLTIRTHHNGFNPDEPQGETDAEILSALRGLLDVMINRRRK